MNPHYKPHIPITTWAEEDRPREKLLLHGRRTLSDSELIAILIGSGSKNESAVDLSKRILNHYQNNLDALGRLSVQELSKFKGIGEAKAISIIAALELGRRRKDAENEQLHSKITSSFDVYKLLSSHFFDLLHEEFWIVLLNRTNRVLSKVLISKGGQSATVSDPKIIFKSALEHNASSIVLAHNHPSGNLKPSSADLQLTKKMVEGGKILDIGVLDHLIFAERKYFSFADEGLM
ncbi:DNA replication and repair protein RadC [Pseudopedobacter saltans DSM 12145]|uniref:DNA replication and repair protein RadC n=1 Tax=Pseudopedobacter saltans (strain ATCC 51119 / DSM 12145 / JCM 21818 / CCUG 39354 / LMG 10337 / NBRC 100064 / NCIMB 13643) TaxID=762903 RepID=F0S737_PSESL|nr:DNA repair protein RadC [Pseudopedobacter saltans]ADY54310.1 DNA replication and repair protein RadC [Pseudopedobacter saltans DSM 12145]